jgi:hypothetical protein
MRKVFAIAALAIIGTGFVQPARATNGFLGGGVYTAGQVILPTLRFGFEDKFLFDFGITFSTVQASNFTVAFKGLARFTEIDGVYIHGGASIGIAEIENDTAFGLGFLVGAEAPINDTFSVTADVVPLSITANGDTEAHFLQGQVGMNIYLF